MAKAAKRQHYIARFYLRNFAEPVLSDNLCYYDLRKQCWERRTPNGVGWFPHLLSMTGEDGKRNDDFDQFLKREVEDPAVPAMKKLATGGLLDLSERPAVALFMALTASRSPETLKSLMEGYLNRLTQEDHEELEAKARQWCDSTGMKYDEKANKEYLKPSGFGGGIWIWSISLQKRLLQWDWHFVKTTRSQPFVTSDRPVFLERLQNLHLVGFPVSSEVAIIITAGGKLNKSHDRSEEVTMVNLQTMRHARKFVVACQETFPGDEHLERHGQST